MEPKQQGQSSKSGGSTGGSKKPNIWLLVSIVLAIALVAVLVIKPNQTSTEGTGAGMTLTVLSPEKASEELLKFINEIYGPQVGTATVKDITERNGLYQAVVNVLDPEGNPVDQVVFITPDAVLFIPQAIEIEAATAQFRALLDEQGNLPPVPAPPEPDPIDDTGGEADETEE